MQVEKMLRGENGELGLGASRFLLVFGLDSTCTRVAC